MEPRPETWPQLAYWERWQVLACAVLLVGPTAAAAVLLRRMRPDCALRPVDMWAPCWRGLHPIWLLAYRAAVLVVMSSILARFVSRDGATSLFFYTQWTFALVIAYFAIGTFLSTRGCWLLSKRSLIKTEEVNEFLDDGAKQDSSSGPFTRENWANDTVQWHMFDERISNSSSVGILELLMQIMYQTSAAAAVLTDSIYWAILVPLYYSDKSGLELVKDGMHSLNLLFLLGDTALNSLSFPWFRMAYFIFWSFSYITFQWIVHACCVKWWPYPFLELETPWAPVWYFGIALVHIPCYSIYWLAVKAKNTYFPRFFPGAYWRSI